MNDSGTGRITCKQTESAPQSREIITWTRHHTIFTVQMLFLNLNQQCQSTEGNIRNRQYKKLNLCHYQSTWYIAIINCWLKSHFLSQSHKQQQSCTEISWQTEPGQSGHWYGCCRPMTRLLCRHWSVLSAASATWVPMASRSGWYRTCHTEPPTDTLPMPLHSPPPCQTIPPRTITIQHGKA